MDPKKYNKSQASSIKSVAAAPSVSPTKKFSKSSNRTLTEVKNLENLESEESDIESEDKTPTKGVTKVRRQDTYQGRHQGQFRFQ